MDISIIIPCYNLENYIARCLNSVINQCYDKDKFEIILILDSCTDKSLEIAVDILGRCDVNSFVMITDVKNAGSARNIGLDIANGEFIYFIDGDDYLTDNYALQKLKSNISINNSNVVYMTAFESEDNKTYEIEKDAIWRYFYRRSLVGQTKFLAAPINEDWLFVKGIKYKPEYNESTIDDVLYHYTHPREGSITAKLEQFLKSEKVKI